MDAPPRPVVDVDEFPPVTGVRHRYVVVRGTRIHIAESGSDTARAVVLLHGFPQHWYAWRHLLASLAADHHVVAVDLPGFGWSDPSRNGYSTAQRSRYVLALLDQLGLGEVDLVGHDWGGWLAFRVALDAPNRVGNLVCVSELHPWPVQRHLLPNLWRMWVTALFEVPGLGALVQKRRTVIRWFLSRDTRDRGVWTTELVDVYAARAARPATARAGQRLHAAFVAHDIARLALGRDRRAPLRTPALLVAGEHDTCIPPGLMTVPRARRQVLRVETVPGGHFLLDENPDGVCRAVRRHLGGGPVGTVEPVDRRRGTEAHRCLQFRPWQRGRSTRQSSSG